MGTTKALLPWGSRCLLAAWVARFAEVGASPIAVVLGADAEFVRASASPDLPEGVEVLWVTNPDPDGTGPRESLLLGLDALPADRAAWFTPIDVPVVDRQTLQAIAEGWASAVAKREDEPMAALPVVDAQRGHPVLAGPVFIARLFQGEPGDRIDGLFEWATRRLVRVPVQATTVLANMNSPADYHGQAPTGEVAEPTVPPDTSGETAD